MNHIIFEDRYSNLAATDFSSARKEYLEMVGKEVKSQCFKRLL